MKSFANYIGDVAAGFEESKGPLGRAAQIEIVKPGFEVSNVVFPSGHGIPNRPTTGRKL